MIYEFKLPDVGEGLTEGEVVRWHVGEGDMVKENQPLVNVLTDKAEVEIPSPKTGKVSKLMAGEGQKVRVGEVLVTFEISDGLQGATPGGARPKETTAEGRNKHDLTAPQRTSSVAENISATPAVRKLAAELYVDLSRVQGTGPGGRVTDLDVRRAAGIGPSPAPSAASPPTSPARAIGPEERIPFIGIRRRTAEKMAGSWRTIPHVTHMDEADYTALVGLRAELQGEAEKRGVKLTYLPFLLKALAQTLQEYPNLNSTLDEQDGFIVRKRYYNIGIATATEQGLLVPVIKDVSSKDVWSLAAEIQRLAEKARANRIEPGDLQGGTFTVTNIGPIGGLYATPIVNHPEVAILGVMKLHEKPVVRDGSVVIRDIVPLVLSFDHRVLDGAEAANFTNALIRRLENPRTLL